MKKRLIVILTLWSLLVVFKTAAAAPAVAGLFLEANDLVYTNRYVNQAVHDAFNRTGNWSEFDWLDDETCRKEAKLWMLNQASRRYRYIEELPNLDMQKLCQELGLDYAVIVFIDNGEGDMRAGFYTDTFTVVVETTLKVFDVKKGKYIFVESSIAEGSSRSSYINLPSASKAYVDGVIKSMSRIRVDTYALP